MKKPLTKKITLGRQVNVYPMYQETYYEMSSELLEKHVIKRMNRKENIIPDNWKLNEKDFNLFMKEYERGNEILFELNEIDVDFDEFEYMDEKLEVDDEDEYSICEKFYEFLYGKGSQDKKTNTYLNIKREIDRRETEEWNKRLKQYEEVQ